MPERVVLLAPHHDDECLWASFLALAYEPDLIVCTHADVQAERGAPITHGDRVAETDAAWELLAPGRGWTQWNYTDVTARADYTALDAAIARLADEYDRVIAPCPEAAGHEQHNRVGASARRHFGEGRAILYLTYTAAGRSTWGDPVPVRHPDWIAVKLRALACYTSQIREPSTQEHFLGALPEYVAA